MKIFGGGEDGERDNEREVTKCSFDAALMGVIVEAWNRRRPGW